MQSDDRAKAAAWARVILEQGALILDTETTGLDGNAEIVQIAIVTTEGRAILNSLVKPSGKIPEEASRIHGITDEHVAIAPTWPDLWPAVRRVIEGRVVVVYNADYDTRLLFQSGLFAGIPMLEINRLTEWHCAMQQYAAWVGDWNSYRRSYRWQRLPGGDHTALGDCLATLGVLKQMAAEEVDNAA
jgi:DNA polymerase-3 subunit epsilon